MSQYSEKKFKSAGQLQMAIADTIRDFKKENPLAPVTLIVDQPLQGLLFRRQVAETLAGDKLTALGNIQVITLSDLIEVYAQSIGIRTDAQPSSQVVEAAIFALMAKSSEAEYKSNQSLATASAIAKVFRSLEYVEDERLRTLNDESFLNATQKDVLSYVLKARNLFAGRLASNKLSNILASGSSKPLSSHFGQIHSLVSALPNNIRNLYRLLAESGPDITHWKQEEVEGKLDVEPTSMYLISCPDPMTEVSVVVRAVMQDLTEYRADRIAIVTPSISEYGSQLQASLNNAGITWHGRGKFIGQQSALFRTLKIISDALAERRADFSGFDRPKLMRLLQNGFLHVQGVNIETKYVRKWVRKNSLYADTAKWIHILDFLSAEALHENDQISAEHLKHLLNYLESHLQSLAHANSWTELGIGLLNLVESLHQGEINLDDDSVEKKRWVGIRKLLLQELPLLDSIDLSSLEGIREDYQGMGLPVRGNLVNLSRWIDSQLGARRVTEGNWSQGIFVGTIESARFLKFDSVYVLGATEGLLPEVSKEDPFLPKKLLDYLAEPEMAAQTSENSTQITLELLSSMIGSSSKTLFTRPRSGTSSKLGDVESRFIPNSLTKESGKRTGHFIEVPSYLSSFQLQGLDLPPVSDFEAALLAPKVENEDWIRFSRSMWAWRNPQFNEYFGNLSALTPATKIWFPTDMRPLSSSRIDTFLRCPYEFFALTVLGFNPNDNRDELKSFSPTAFGTFFHKQMELFIKYCKTEGLLPEPGRPWDEPLINGFLSRITDKNVLDSYVATGRAGWGTSFDFHLRKVIRGVVEFFATEPLVLRGSPPLKIESAEEPFGKAGNRMHLVVADDDGKKHWLVGQMDRLDISEDQKFLGVMDFKTGSRDKQQKKLGIGKSKKPSTRQSQNVYTLQDVIYRRAVLSQYEEAQVNVNFVFIAEKGEDMYLNAIFAHDPNDLLPKKLGEIRRTGESGLFIPQTAGSTYDHEYCRVCSSLGDASDVVKEKYKKSLANSAIENGGGQIEGADSDE